MLKKVFIFTITLCLVLSALIFYSTAADNELRSITEIDFSSVSKVYFKGETNKDFTSYSVGEEMIFIVTMYADGEQITAPYFYYTVKGDDGAKTDGYLAGDTGEIKISTSVSRPGAVLLTVVPCDASKQPITDSKITSFGGGALAGAEDITTTIAEPADFSDFWNDTLGLLDSPKIDFIYSFEYTSGGVTYDALELEINVPVDDYYKETYPQLWEKDGERHYVYVYVAVPQGADAGSLPLDITYYGRDKMVPGLAVDPGKIVMTVGPHCVPASHNVAEGEDEANVSNGAYTNAYYESLHDKYSYRSNLGFGAATNELPETCYFKYMHLRNVQALRFAKECFGENGIAELSSFKGLWNGEDIKVSGMSQGGMQSLAVAALCPEVTEVSVNIPWFADVAGNTDSLKIQSTLRPAYRSGLAYMDSAIFAKHIKAENVSITGGTCDTLCPMSAVQSIYNNLNTNATIRFVQGMAHGSTNTYQINSYQSKTYNENIIEHTDLFYIGSEYASLADDFSAAWETVNGRAAKLYTDKEEFLSASGDSKHYIDISAFGASGREMSSTSELEAFVENNGIDSYNTVFTAENSLSEYDKAILELSSNEDNRIFNVISIFEEKEGTALARKLASDLSGVLFGNQISDGEKLTVISEDGKIIYGIAVTENVEAFKAYPVITPAYDLYGASLTEKYTVSDGSGIYNVSANGTEREIKVFSSADMSVYGSDAGADYIILGNTLNIYGTGAISDTSYEWNEYITDVEEIVINTGVTSIGDGAFNAPDGATIRLPYTVLSIDANAFCGKTDILIIGYSGSGTESMGVSSFTSLGTVGACGTDVYFIYKDGILEITGTGNRLESCITSYGGKENCAWYAHYNDITKVILGENITELGGRSFHYMPALTTVEITENLKKINGSAFEGGPALTTVYLNGNEAEVGTVDLSTVTSIGGGAFNDCKKVKKFILSSELSGEIGSNTFQLCSGISEMTIPAGVTKIGTSAFSDASSLRTLTVLGKNTVIAADAFKSTWTSDLVKKVKIISYIGSVAHGLAKSEGLVFEDIETGKITDFSASPAQFMTFEGYQVRIDEYNGLRSLFTVDKNRLPTFDNEGYEIFEYGTVMASQNALEKYGEELTVTVSEDGTVSKSDYTALIPIFRSGKTVGKLLTNTADEATFACTVVNFKQNNFDKNIVVRGYVIIKDAAGNYSVHYSDYVSSEYAAVSLEMVCDGLYESGEIDANCISYIHVEEFRKIRDDELGNDNEFDPGDIFELDGANIDKLTLNGEKMDGLSLYANDPVLKIYAEQIKELFYKYALVELEIVSDEIPEKGIILTFDSENYRTESISVENGKIIITSAYGNPKFAYDKLKEILDGAKNRELDITDAVNYVGEIDYSGIYTKEELMTLLGNVYESDSVIVGELADDATNKNSTLISSGLERFKSVTGEYPGLMSIDVASSFVYINEGGDDMLHIAEELINYAANGGIIVTHAHMSCPTNPTEWREGSLDYLEWKELFEEGSELNTVFYELLSKTADFFELLDKENVPVIWRPYHEINGNWFWWGAGRKDGILGLTHLDASNYKKLWTMTYEYLTVTRGLDNLIWVYNPSVGATSDTLVEPLYCYPGDEYVDIVGMDWYSNGDYSVLENTPTYNDLKSTGKIVNMCEFGLVGDALVEPDLGETGEQKDVFSCLDVLTYIDNMNKSDYKTAYWLFWQSNSSITGMGYADEFMQSEITLGLKETSSMFEELRK